MGRYSSSRYTTTTLLKENEAWGASPTLLQRLFGVKLQTRVGISDFLERIPSAPPARGTNSLCSNAPILIRSTRHQRSQGMLRLWHWARSGGNSKQAEEGDSEHEESCRRLQRLPGIRAEQTQQQERTTLPCTASDADQGAAQQPAQHHRLCPLPSATSPDAGFYVQWLSVKQQPETLLPTHHLPKTASRLSAQVKHGDAEG